MNENLDIVNSFHSLDVFAHTICVKVIDAGKGSHVG